MTGCHGRQTHTLHNDIAVQLAGGVDVPTNVGRYKEKDGLACDGAAQDDNEGDDTEGELGEFGDDVITATLARSLLVSLDQSEDIPRRGVTSDGRRDFIEA